MLLSYTLPGSATPSPAALDPEDKGTFPSHDSLCPSRHFRSGQPSAERLVHLHLFSLLLSLSSLLRDLLCLTFGPQFLTFFLLSCFLIVTGVCRFSLRGTRKVVSCYTLLVGTACVSQPLNSEVIYTFTSWESHPSHVCFQP